MNDNPLIVKVLEDETLLSISQKYNIPVELIKKYNDNIDLVRCGMRIIIPFCVKNVHIVRPLQTLEEIAKIYSTTVEKLIEDNDIVAPLFIGQQLLIK